MTTVKKHVSVYLGAVVVDKHLEELVEALITNWYPLAPNDAECWIASQKSHAIHAAGLRSIIAFQMCRWISYSPIRAARHVPPCAFGEHQHPNLTSGRPES